MLHVHLVHGKIREGDVWFFVTNPKSSDWNKRCLTDQTKSGELLL